MKNILVVLSVVAMLFTSCITQSETLPRPEFPELNNLTVGAGRSYKLTFVAETNWLVSLPAESQPYATLRFEGFTDTSHSGAAGEHTITLLVNSGVGSYFEDIVFNIEITMNGYTENLAVCTVPKDTRKITVTGVPNAGFEESVQADFVEDGHPEDSPFAACENRYSVVYKKGLDASDANFVVAHDFGYDCDYVVYAKNASGEFEPVTEDASSWLELRAFGEKEEKHRLHMNYTNSKAVLTKGVGYEAYVNVVDEKKNLIISVYYLYNPDAEVVVERTFGLADAELAASKGITLTGSGLSYTLTWPSYEDEIKAETFTTDYLNAEFLAAALKFTGYESVNFGLGSGTTNLVIEHNEESDVYYLRLAEDVSLDALVRTDVLNVSAVGDSMVSYTINLVFGWIKAEEGVETDGSVSFVNENTANDSGATLVKLNSGDEGYDSESTLEHQYLLTYTSASLFETPASVALNIPGFVDGMVVNTDDIGAEHFNYSEGLEFSKDVATGDIYLKKRVLKDQDENVVEFDVPNGSCELFCLDANGTKFIRILFVLGASTPATK